MARGYAPIDFPDDESMNRDEFPQNDPALQQPTAERTIVMLGGNAARFGFEFDGFRNGHNWIRYTEGWDRENIVKLPIEGLEKLPPFFTRELRVHKSAAGQFARLFDEWKRAGLFNRILSYAGTHTARYKKGVEVNGAHSNLSNHAWGTAIDINDAWNGFGKHPAAMGDRGCVRELVEIANGNSFFWGGRFRTKDGMHFEVARLLP
jgi:hypothetical protein